MHAILYRWRVRAGAEDDFRRGWNLLTTAIHEQCGSYGSRLHRAEDGSWVAYARWPDRATAEACDPEAPQAKALLGDSIESGDDPLHLDLVSDLLAEPRD